VLNYLLPSIPPIPPGVWLLHAPGARFLRAKGKKFPFCDASWRRISHWMSMERFVFTFWSIL